MSVTFAACVCECVCVCFSFKEAAARQHGRGPPLLKRSSSSSNSRVGNYSTALRYPHSESAELPGTQSPGSLR